MSDEDSDYDDDIEAEEENKYFQIYESAYKQYHGIDLKKHQEIGEIVEASSLSYIKLERFPVDVNIPDELFKDGTLTDLQLETIVYANRAMESVNSGKRCGFLIGDGAGVGKTRPICGVILHNYNEGRKKAIWVSFSTDLYHDTAREFAKLDKKVKCANFALVCNRETPLVDQDINVLFCTYKALSQKFNQITSFIDTDYDGVIVLDECHSAKNCQKTKIGENVMALQTKFLNARVLYSSATMASDISHLEYMDRLGLWGDGTNFEDSKAFLNSFSDTKLSAVELICVDLKRRGLYVSRQLSFEGIDYQVHQVEPTDSFQQLYKLSSKIWRQLFKFGLMQKAEEKKISAIRNKLKKAKVTSQRKSTRSPNDQSTSSPDDQSTSSPNDQSTSSSNDEVTQKDKKKQSIMQALSSASQRFFQCLVVGSKVDLAIAIAKRERKENKRSIIFGIQTTGESGYEKYCKSGNTYLQQEFSAAREILERLLVEHFGYKPAFFHMKDDIPIPALSDTDDSESSSDEEMETDSSTEVSEFNKTAKYSERLRKLQDNINDKLCILLVNLPKNTLDRLVADLGGRDKVAEMTGRLHALDYEPIFDRNINKRRRQNHSDATNEIERNRFMFKDMVGMYKKYGIISDVASTGVSLHADRECDNTDQRVHITLELPWSSEKAIQQFGRTNRTNQAVKPIYVSILSPVPAEHRFTSAVMQRMKTMGAITKGDQNATEVGLSSIYNSDPSYGRRSVELLYNLAKSGTLEDIFEDEFIDEPCPSSDRILRIMEKAFIINQKKKFIGKCSDFFKFLNRVLLMDLEDQETIMKVLQKCADHIIQEDKSSNKFDAGIRDFTIKKSDRVLKGLREYILPMKGLPGRMLCITSITTDRGLRWEDPKIQKLIKRDPKTNKSFGTFYASTNGRLNQSVFCFVSNTQLNKKSAKYKVLGTMFSPSFDEKHDADLNLVENFEIVQDVTRCAELWKAQYEKMGTESPSMSRKTSYVKCIHEYMYGNCREEGCTYNARLRENFVLHGTITEVWSEIAEILKPVTSMRIKMSNGATLVGLKIKIEHVSQVKELMNEYCEQRQIK